MNVQALLEQAKANGLTLSLKDGKLKVAAAQEPEGEVKSLIQDLKKHRIEVLKALGENDPKLTPEDWYSEFHRFYVQVVQSTPDFDWAWAEIYRPDMIVAIKDKECDLDDLGETRLSNVMAILKDWRSLILKVDSYCIEANKQQIQSVSETGPLGSAPATQQDN